MKVDMPINKETKLNYIYIYIVIKLWESLSNNWFIKICDLKTLTIFEWFLAEPLEKQSGVKRLYEETGQSKETTLKKWQKLNQTTWNVM